MKDLANLDWNYCHVSGPRQSVKIIKMVSKPWCTVCLHNTVLYSNLADQIFKEQEFYFPQVAVGYKIYFGIISFGYNIYIGIIAW